MCVHEEFILLLLTVWDTIQVRRLAFSPDGNLLGAGCDNGHVYIYGLANDKWAQVSVMKHHSNHV